MSNGNYGNLNPSDSNDLRTVLKQILGNDKDYIKFKSYKAGKSTHNEFYLSIYPQDYFRIIHSSQYEGLFIVHGNPIGEAFTSFAGEAGFYEYSSTPSVIGLFKSWLTNIKRDINTDKNRLEEEYYQMEASTIKDLDDLLVNKAQKEYSKEDKHTAAFAALGKFVSTFEAMVTNVRNAISYFVMVEADIKINSYLRILLADTSTYELHKYFKSTLIYYMEYNSPVGSSNKKLFTLDEKNRLDELIVLIAQCILKAGICRNTIVHADWKHHSENEFLSGQKDRIDKNYINHQMNFTPQKFEQFNEAFKYIENSITHLYEYMLNRPDENWKIYPLEELLIKIDSKRLTNIMKKELSTQSQNY